MNKKGLTISKGVEAIIVLLVALFALTAIFTSMDLSYGQSHTFLFNGSSYMQDIIDYQNSSQGQLNVEWTIFGLQLKSFAVIQAILSILWKIVGGGWIPDMFKYAMPNWSGAIVIGYMFQAAWIISLVFATIALLTKRKP
jgi:hypothetical protein